MIHVDNKVGHVAHQKFKDSHMDANPQINKLFRWVVLKDGSGVKLEPDHPPVIVGKPGVGEVAPLSEEAITELVLAIMDPEARHALEENGLVEFTHRVPENGALFRVEVQRRQGQLIVQAMLLGVA